MFDVWQRAEQRRGALLQLVRRLFPRLLCRGQGYKQFSKFSQDVVSVGPGQAAFVCAGAHSPKFTLEYRVMAVLALP
jgi:hypothetical protein